eukprot:8862598-Pyramimonas_sp.AAC.1
MVLKVIFAIPAEFTVQVRANVLGEVKEVAGVMLGDGDKSGDMFRRAVSVLQAACNVFPTGAQIP